MALIIINPIPHSFVTSWVFMVIRQLLQSQWTFHLTQCFHQMKHKQKNSAHTNTNITTHVF